MLGPPAPEGTPPPNPRIETIDTRNHTVLGECLEIALDSRFSDLTKARSLKKRKASAKLETYFQTGDVQVRLISEKAVTRTNNQYIKYEVTSSD